MVHVLYVCVCCTAVKLRRIKYHVSFTAYRLSAVLCHYIVFYVFVNWCVVVVVVVIIIFTEVLMLSC